MPTMVQVMRMVGDGMVSRTWRVLDDEDDEVMTVEDEAMTTEDEAMPSNKRVHMSWCEEEDQQLREYMEFKQEEMMPQGRSKGACQRRWYRLNKPGPLLSSQEEWTPEEDETALRGVEVIPGRSYAAIEKRRSILRQERDAAEQPVCIEPIAELIEALQ